MKEVGGTKKLSMLETLKKEARDEIIGESSDKWKSELKLKMRALTKAQQLVRNCERDIEDLEMRISEEIG
jgi:hypothetical protein